MKARLLLLGVALVLSLLMAGAVLIYASASGLPQEAEVAGGDRQVSGQAGSAIIVDHTCTDLSKIPDYWIGKAQELAIHYAHTSHGSQIVTGLDKLEQVDAGYVYHWFSAGGSPPVSLPCPSGELCMYDGNPPETYITPEDYWQSTGGIARTQDVADTGLFGYSMWSWCGQASYYSDSQIQDYLDQVDAFEAQYPSMRFILMTGHTDGGSTDLARHNGMIRQHAIDNGMVLFDFADIETYDPLGGGPYDNNGEGTCTWCESFCISHPEYCHDLPSSCAHSDSLPYASLFCKLKANAFWWMMARLAGWDGSGGSLAGSVKTATPSTVDAGNVLTYSIRLENTGSVLPGVQVTDTLPAEMSYAGGLSCSSGACGESGDVITWTGSVDSALPVTISFVVTVDPSLVGAQLITNTASIDYGAGAPLRRHALVIVNPFRCYLPMVRRVAP